MFGLNPVASGILIGSIVAPGLGTVIGGGIGLMQENARAGKQDALNAQRDAERKAVGNQNALVEDQYNKKQAARGLSDSISNPATPLAPAPTASGASMNSMTGNDPLINLLG